MKVGTIGGLLTFEDRQEAERRERLRHVHEERLRIARTSHTGAQIPDDLVERGHRGHFRVSASTDYYYTPITGAVFLPNSAMVVADRAPYCFTVSEDGELVFYERQRGTWSEHLERQDRRRTARS